MYTKALYMREYLPPASFIVHKSFSYARILLAYIIRQAGCSLQLASINDYRASFSPAATRPKHHRLSNVVFLNRVDFAHEYRTFQIRRKIFSNFFFWF